MRPGLSHGGGKVYLVGAGPGDPDLLTVKATRLLRTADVVLYDSLTSDGIIDGISDDVRAIDVGKKPDAGTRTAQSSINELLRFHADAGHVVVRLKGGDPLVFGRGGEEAEYLAEANIPFEIVPGVTSVVGAPGVVGIPLTHREYASSVTVVTGHEDPSKDESALDWEAIGRSVTAGGTLVVLMGVRRLPEIVHALREHGVASTTPVAMVEKATWEDEQTVTGRLATIVDMAVSRGVSPPAVTVVGEVVGVKEAVSAWLRRDESVAVARSAIAIAPGEIEQTESDWRMPTARYQS